MDFMKYMSKKYDLEKIDKRKRNRSDNWVPADKTSLEELVMDGRLDIVDNKNTDSYANTMKKEAWLEIQESFNKTCQGPKRTVLQLKSQWACIKTAKNKAAKAISALPSTSLNSDPPTTSSKCSTSAAPIKSSPPTSPVSSRSSVSSAPSSPSTPSTPPSPVPSSPLPEDRFVPSPRPSRPSTQKRPPQQKPKENYLEKIAAMEMRCRTELHRLQVQNELLKNKMLLKKLEVQEQKLKYYKLECSAVKRKK